MNDEAWVKEFKKKFDKFHFVNWSGEEPTSKQLIAFISQTREEAKREERKRIREALEPAFKDLSDGATLMIQNNFPNAGGEILEDVGYMKSVVLDSLTGGHEDKEG